MERIKCPYLKGRQCDNKQNRSRNCKFKNFQDCHYFKGSQLPKYQKTLKSFKQRLKGLIKQPISI